MRSSSTLGKKYLQLTAFTSKIIALYTLYNEIKFKFTVYFVFLYFKLISFSNVYTLSDIHARLFDLVESYFTYLTNFPGSCLLQETISYP